MNGRWGIGLGAELRTETEMQVLVAPSLVYRRILLHCAGSERDGEEEGPDDAVLLLHPV